MSQGVSFSLTGSVGLKLSYGDRSEDRGKKPEGVAGVERELAACGKSQTALRAAFFRQNCVPESLKITNIHAILRLVLTKKISLSFAEHFHHRLLVFRPHSCIRFRFGNQELYHA